MVDTILAYLLPLAPRQPILHGSRTLIYSHGLVSLVVNGQIKMLGRDVYREHRDGEYQVVSNLSLFGPVSQVCRCE